MSALRGEKGSSQAVSWPLWARPPTASSLAQEKAPTPTSREFSRAGSD